MYDSPLLLCLSQESALVVREEIEKFGPSETWKNDARTAE